LDDPLTAVHPIATTLLRRSECSDVPLAYQSGQPLSPFKVASDFDTVLVLNGCVSLRRTAEVKGRSITCCVPTIFPTVFVYAQAVFFSPPFEDIFVVIHPKWIRLSIDPHPSIAIVGNTQT
jgi:hypothetical protein